MAGKERLVKSPVKNYGGRLTVFVLGSCIVAASGGFIFGVGNGITGGITSVDPFLKKFFADVYSKMKKAETDDYCKFDSQVLTWFTSSLFISGLIATLFASPVTRTFGRKISMLIGGTSFLAGAALGGAAVNVAMLILGRIMLGIGVGFANQAVLVYLSEMAPARMRGALNVLFQLLISCGVLVAHVINYGTGKIHDWGWRLSLSLAAVPAIILTVGSLCLPDTPNSLIERGQSDQVRALLERIRGTPDVQDEFHDLIEASEASRLVKHPFRIIIKRKYRPQLVMSVLFPFFQQFTGIDVITFYAPVLFRMIGLGSDSSLMSAVIIQIVALVGTCVAVFSVDMFGRRPLLLQGGFQMFISLVLLAAVLGVEFGTSAQDNFSKGNSYFLVFLMCVYVLGFGWSFGPLGWLVPSEIFPVEVRSAGQSITVSVNLLFTFVVGQYSANDLRVQVRNLPVLRRVGADHDSVCSLLSPRNQKRAHRRNEQSVERTQALENYCRGRRILAGRYRARNSTSVQDVHTMAMGSSKWGMVRFCSDLGQINVLCMLKQGLVLLIGDWFLFLCFVSVKHNRGIICNCGMMYDNLL